MEQRIIMPQAEIDALWEKWGMGDYDRALQNLELERRILAQDKAELMTALKLLREDHSRMEPHHEDLCNTCKLADAALAKANL